MFTLSFRNFPRLSLLVAATVCILVCVMASGCQDRSSPKGPESNPSAPHFAFYLKNEPQTLDPALVVSGESSYLISNLYRGLTRYTDEMGLIFDRAERCSYKPENKVNCHLRKEARWSDGTPITAQDYVDSFRRLISPGTKFSNAFLLFSIHNAKEIYKGSAKPDSLGMVALDAREIEFSLDYPDQEFLEKLSDPSLVAFRSPANGNWEKLLTSGPYKISGWDKRKRIVLVSNALYDWGNSARPPVDIYFASDDTTALNLYEKGTIDFLWRLPTAYIPKYKDRPDFVQVAVNRFDYIGFNLKPGSVFEKREIRKAFATSLDFQEFKKLFFALGAPGCPGLGDRLLLSRDHCIEYQANQPPLKLNKKLVFYYSQLGGDDLKKSAEWFQEQWRKHLGVEISIKPLEQKHLLEVLKTSPPDFFRKGVGLSRPTCLAGLEVFKKDNPENFTAFNNLRFENLTKALATEKMNESERRSVCGVATDLLFKEEYVGIPLGRIHFTMLANKKFSGWKVNELNQLDLSDLSYAGDPK